MQDPDWDELPERTELEGAFDRLQRRDWELWSIALILLTAFAGGVMVYFYAQSGNLAGESSPAAGFFWQILFAMVALVILLNVYLIDRKRSLGLLWRRYLLQSQELHRVRELGSLDPLTQVFNRRHFEEVVRTEALRSERSEQPLSFMLLDLKEFERINRSKGHFVGDRILQAVARILRKTMRTSDMIFRYGGDDFIILLPNTPQEGALCAEKRLWEQLNSDKEILDKLGEAVPMVISHSCYQKGDSLDAVLEQAEKALSA